MLRERDKFGHLRWQVFRFSLSKLENGDISIKKRKKTFDVMAIVAFCGAV